MSPGPEMHDPHFSDLMSLYAVGALPPHEVALVEAHLAGCEACRQDVATLRPIVDAFASWPTDVLRPSTALWDRLAQRIATDTGQAPLPAQESAEPAWTPVASGIECKLLATDRDTHTVSMLVRLAPGAEYPPHRHAGVEELYLLDGELMIDDKKLVPGDYNRAEPGTVDRRVWSETGCTCVLITSARDELG